MPEKKPRAKAKATEPTSVVGSHLTVTTYPDGSTTLSWDDEALMRDVREALASVEQPKNRNGEPTDKYNSWGMIDPDYR